MGQFRPNNIKSVVGDKSAWGHLRDPQQRPGRDLSHWARSTAPRNSGGYKDLSRPWKPNPSQHFPLSSTNSRCLLPFGHGQS